MFYYDWSILIILPGLLLGIWAQIRVKSSFSKYAKVHIHSGKTAEQICRELLNNSGNSSVRIEQTKGSLTDHFDPSNNVLRLSQSVYGSDSVSAIGVAAHECGHAMQKHDGYKLLSLRTAIVPVVSIGSNLYFPLFLIGIIFSWEPLQIIGISCFALTLLFSLITLPVEFDASKRAIAMLSQGGYVDESELTGVRSVLTSAAMTYVASAISSLLQLIRLILISRSRD